MQNFSKIGQWLFLIYFVSPNFLLLIITVCQITLRIWTIQIGQKKPQTKQTVMNSATHQAEWPSRQRRQTQ